MTQARLPYSRRSGPGFGLALALFLCAGMPALAQTGGEAVRDGPVPVTADPGPPSARDVLNAELARMRAERAELARFIAWQEKLVRAAKSDPAAALARQGTIPCDSDNAAAAAYRDERLQVVSGGADTPGALVAPLASAEDRAGVMTLEVNDGWETSDAVQSTATIIAAQLATLVAADPSG